MTYGCKIQANTARTSADEHDKMILLKVLETVNHFLSFGPWRFASQGIKFEARYYRN